MTEQNVAKLISKLRTESKRWREQVGEMPLFDQAADALEQMATTLEYDAAYMKNLEAERDAAYAVIEQAVKYAKYDFGTGIQGLLAIADTVPTDALREVKAQAWAEGYASGQDSTYVDISIPNPYREEQHD